MHLLLRQPLQSCTAIPFKFSLSSNATGSTSWICSSGYDGVPKISTMDSGFYPPDITLNCKVGRCRNIYMIWHLQFWLSLIGVSFLNRCSLQMCVCRELRVSGWQEASYREVFTSMKFVLSDRDGREELFPPKVKNPYKRRVSGWHEALYRDWFPSRISSFVVVIVGSKNYFMGLSRGR